MIGFIEIGDPVVQMLLTTVAMLFFAVIFPNWILYKIEKTRRD